VAAGPVAFGGSGGEPLNDRGAGGVGYVLDGAGELPVVVVDCGSLVEEGEDGGGLEAGEEGVSVEGVAVAAEAGEAGVVDGAAGGVADLEDDFSGDR
jgi:hypothetical protein